jgi:hypothetical protein
MKECGSVTSMTIGAILIPTIVTFFLFRNSPLNHSFFLKMVFLCLKSCFGATNRALSHMRTLCFFFKGLQGI